ARRRLLRPPRSGLPRRTARLHARGQPLPAPTLHGLFAAQAARTPGALALVCGRETLTYAELDARSAALARRLRRLGVGPEVPVGVCLPRTADLVAGLLAVLRAGGFYVPLDPAYPAERLGYMLADSRCRLALTTGSAAAVLPTGAVRLLRLDDPATPPTPADIALDAGPGDDAGDPEVLPNNLAYLIYTSGSTGRPKAVAIEHRSAALLTGWARNVFSPAELAGVVASTSIAFDVSVFELFATLTSGGTVILVENALAIPALKNPGALPAGVEARLAPMVPSAAAELLRSDGLPATVATLNLGGEALPRALAQRAYERPETARVYNLYGPSEDTTYSTFALIARGPGRTSPIGRPVDGTRAYVLDRRLQPMPAGVPGELYLAGGGLARGYLGRPELTAERFLPDPLADEPGARMYKTGDLTFQRAGGELECLGRIDRQVKVRGFRIELGEVEAALAAVPGVRQVAAMVRSDRSDGSDRSVGSSADPRLVAYVTGDATAGELRAALRERLPDYMVPAAVMVLPALPLNPNGKVDRHALPAATPSGAGEYAAPQGDAEQALALLWQEVRGLERVGRRDNFFEL
ncbi:MAG TPA: amino acid adenylation domain-containing protein, partial [Thermoanaerobaculia bacterium]